MVSTKIRNSNNYSHW